MSVNNSIEQMSNKFIKEKAHFLDEDTIEFVITDIAIYPNSTNPTFIIHCGFPLEDYFIRLELDSLFGEGYDKILDLYPKPFTSLDSIVGNTINIKLKNNSFNKNVYNPTKDTSQMGELETPVKFNTWDVHLSKVLRGYEYGIKKHEDINQIKKDIEYEITRYEMIQDSIDNNEGLKVQNLYSDTERSFILEIGKTEDITLPICVKLPALSEVNSHPVSDFINNFASGQIKNLESETVYIGLKDNKNCIGADNKYSKYGLHKSYPNDKSKSWFKNLF